MNLQKIFWKRNEAKTRGYVFKAQNQDDYQQAFVSQGPVKKMKK